MIRIGTKALGLLVAGTIFGGIALSAALGLWKTQGSKEPAAIRSGEFAGLPSPSDIRGSYTWADVGKAFDIPPASLVLAFGAGSEAEKANSLEAKYGEAALPPGAEIGTDSVRLFVALYTGLPHEPEADTILPMAAIEVLRAEAKGDRALVEAAALRAYAPGAPAPAAGSASAAAQAAPPASPAPASSAAPAAAAKPATAPAAPTPNAPAAAAPASSAAPAAPVGAESAPAAGAAPKAGTAAATEYHEPAAGSIVGKTTFGELEEWGFDMAAVEALLGGLGKPGESVRDYCSAKGLSFSEMKPRLQELAPKK